MAIIWTKHATLRNKERKISTDWVEKTVNGPDQSFAENEGRTKYTKSFGKQTVSVITAKGDNGEYLILSAWIDPPNPGTYDYKKEKYRHDMRESGRMKKFLLTFLHQIGI